MSYILIWMLLCNFKACDDISSHPMLIYYMITPIPVCSPVAAMVIGCCFSHKCSIASGKQRTVSSFVYTIQTWQGTYLDVFMTAPLNLRHLNWIINYKFANASSLDCVEYAGGFECMDWICGLNILCAPLYGLRLNHLKPSFITFYFLPSILHWEAIIHLDSIAQLSNKFGGFLGANIGYWPISESPKFITHSVILPANYKKL